MADSIGRADYELGATLDKLRASITEAEQVIAASGKKAEAEYAEAGRKSSRAFTGALKEGTRVLAGAAAGVFAVAAAGSVELQNAAAGFRAETGATAQEAERAARAINEMSGRNVQGLGEITGALTKVHTDLGLTGDEAEKTTERFLRYARVTKQDASAAVLAFDDVLDAWGLTAADAQGLMDKLIVSHQRYGGSITANQDALARMAPALRALNSTTDDGIALLNLFAASGLDAGAAQRGLNTAVAKMPKGTNLAQFVAELAAIEDPAKRAARATEVFGSMAGPKLANALGNATDGLDAYAVSQEAAAEATTKANEALESTFSAQIAAKIRAVGSAIRGLGADWGPALTGASSLTLALSALGLDKALSKAWKTAAGSAPVQALVRSAALKATGAYLAATMAGGMLSSVVASAWSKVAGSSAVLAAARMAGGTVAAAFAMAATAAIIAAPVAVAWFFTQKDASDRTAQVAAQQLVIQGMKDEGTSVQALRDKWKELQSEAWALWQASNGRDGLIADVFGTKAENEKNLAAVKAMLADVEVQLGKALGEPAGRDIGQGWTTGIATGVKAGNGALTKAAEQTVWDVRQAIIDGKASLVSAWSQALSERNAAANAKDQIIINNAEIAAARRVLADKKATAAEKAEARIRIRNLQASNAELRVEQSKHGTRQEQIAKTKALLTSKALLKGLKDKDPDIVAYWKKVKHDLEVQLGNLEGTGFIYGQGFTRGFIRGLVKDIDSVGENARRLARVVKKYLQVRSPSELGPFSEMGGPEGWGSYWMDLYAKGLRGGLPAINAMLGDVLGFAGPESWASAAAVSAGPAPASFRAERPGSQAPAARGDTHIHIHVDGLLRAETPDDVGRALRRLGALGLVGGKA